ncbi:hypothetical protein [Halocola ammonii]
MRYLIALLFCFTTILFGCENNHQSTSEETEKKEVQSVSFQNTSSEKEKIADGFYLILNTWQDSASAHATEGKVIRYSHDFLDENTTDQPRFIEVDTSDFVPLTLSQKPDSIEQEDKRIKLLLSMTEPASARLADYTEKHVNEMTCIVIGGKAVTMHKIREKITGGKLQISRCTDNACKHLLLELEDNVAE